MQTRWSIRIRTIAGVSLAIVLLTPGAPLGAITQSPPAQAAKSRSYKATRAFVVDKDTGAARMPTQQEVDDVVANLATLGQRATETLPQSSHASGAEIVGLDGGFGGMLLARPTQDGTWETKCVFTLEEGAEFLGLVVDEAVKG
jgi:hypothetical protein